MRLLLYSHDGLGLGHTRRHLAVAAALAELAPDASILVATGADEINRLGLPAWVEVLKLPSLRKVANGEYASRRLRVPVAEIRRLRSALLQAAVSTFRPRVVLVDKHPLGAGGEFREALETVRQQGGGCVLGLRDILDDRKTVLGEWATHGLRERITEYYDQVLVYGERAVFDPVREYEFSEALARRTSFCGYVVNRDDHETSVRPWPLTAQSPEDTRPVVIATAGGGEDGYLLLQNFIQAAAGARWQGIAVAGPMVPENERAHLQTASLRAGVGFQAFLPGLAGHFWSVGALVCMGGYNTLVEAVSKGVPTVCVPRTQPRAEQLLRAQAFEQLGLLTLIRPDELSPHLLRDRIDQALTCRRSDLVARANAQLRFDGARQAAVQLLSLANQRPVNSWPREAVVEPIAEAI